MSYKFNLQLEENKSEYSKEDVEKIISELSIEADAELKNRNDTKNKEIIEKLGGKYEEGKSLEDQLLPISQSLEKFNKSTTEETFRRTFKDLKGNEQLFDQALKLADTSSPEKFKETIQQAFKTFPNLLEGYVGGEAFASEQTSEAIDMVVDTAEFNNKKNN